MLGELPCPFEALVHKCSLMRQQFYLLVKTPGANVSQAIQWLNVSYSIWLNCQYRQLGPRLQGRFEEILGQQTVQILEASRYVPPRPGLNPAF